MEDFEIPEVGSRKRRMKAFEIPGVGSRKRGMKDFEIPVLECGSREKRHSAWPT
jgi:hypothetical protein